MPSDSSAPVAELTTALKRCAVELGFDLVGVAPAARPDGFDWLRRWLDHGFAGVMNYIPRRESAYEHPRGVLPSVCSVVMLAMNYFRDDAARTGELPDRPLAGHIARYACGSRDYHDVLRERMQALADFLHEQRPGCRTRGCVDTAPLLERDFARRAGLGWFGKNTMLLNKRLGSWFFLAALLTDVELEADAPHDTAHCGTCTRCLEACPTQAFVEPYVLDARRCISYLTIELRDQPVPDELRPLMGDWIFGCDVCQEVCPWNRKAPTSSELAFAPRPESKLADLQWLASLDADSFERAFAGTPLHRTGRVALQRNVAIALGNSGSEAAIPILEKLSESSEPLICEAAEWGLRMVRG